MDYEAVLAQVLDLLQREQRIAYRVLKRRFQLDDEILEDLKDDVIYAKQLAVDEDGRVLVWTGGPSRAPTTASPVPPAVTSAVAPPQGEASPVLPPPDAERRQLTVLFCDLVESTALSRQLDPEEYRDLVRAYQRVCADVITRFDGHIAQLLGDGLLVYFGYPHAHEDDALRAVHTGLGMLEALAALNISLEPAKGITLAVRLGIHTGLVVVGEMGGGQRQEQLALGDVPNMASRIEGLAAPNTLVMSEATSRLVQGYFDCEALGVQTLRGVAEPVQVYRVLQASGARGRLDVAVTRGLTPLVGRESEITLLLERWAQAKSGQGQVMLLTGDAGIGKSRMVQMLKEHVAHEPHVRWECRSAEYYQNTALFPVTDLFQRLLQFQVEDTPDEKVGKLEQALRQYRLPVEESVQLFAPLLSLSLPEDKYPPLHLSPQRQRQKALETIVAILLELAERQPVLFILEDLHWTDPTTLEFLGLLVEQVPTAAIYTLLTCRPHFQPAWHHRSYLTEMTIHRLSPAQVEQIVNRMTDGKTFPTEVLQQIIEKTDGVPLFVEEMTKAILESGQLKARNGHYELVGSFSTLAIPTTLHDSLMARLDRLMTAKVIAQLGATIGRQFSYVLLQAVSQLDEVMLQHELGRLVEAEIVYQRGVSRQALYTFKHALIQDAAYESLLKSTRQQYHQRIAQALEEHFPDLCKIQPELLAQHYTEAGLIAQAIPYWQRAGQHAIERSANREAISHLTKGLELLNTLPDTLEHRQQELDMQTTLGRALSDTKGLAAPEVAAAYHRARELCQQAGEPSQLLPVLRGLVLLYVNRGEFQTARELGGQMLSLAQHVQDPVGLADAHIMLGNALFFLGERGAARPHLEQGIAFYNAQPHRSQVLSPDHLGVFGLSRLTQILWELGYPDQALQRSQEALTLARELAHPFSLATALIFAAYLHQHRREAHMTYERAEAALELSREQGFALRLAQATILRGWALVEQGQGEAGIAQICQGLAALRVTGVAIGSDLRLLAEAYGKVGQIEEGLRVIEGQKGAELYRLNGELLLTRSSEHQAEAETCFHQALEAARRQQAKSWELRVTMSLARLWQRQGKRAEAHDLLAPAYGWFTEGFDTADLQEAKALLEELAG